MSRRVTTITQCRESLVAVLLVCVLTLAPAVALAAAPAVWTGDATASPGEKTTVPVVLESAPNGVSSYNLTVSVSETDVATIDGAQYPDHFGGPEYPVVAEDGSSVTVRAADTNREVESGATDVVLAKVRLTGQSAGEATLSLSVHRLDDDQGSPVTDETNAGSLTVEGDSSESTTDGDDATATESERASQADATDSEVTESATEAATEGDARRSPATDSGGAAGEAGATRGSSTERSVTAATPDGEADGRTTDDAVTGTTEAADSAGERPTEGAVTISFDELDGATIGLVVGLLLPTVVLVGALLVVVR